MRKNTNTHQHPAGTSVIIALIIGMVMLYFAASTTAISSTALKESRMFNAADEAYYNAESALEQGIYAYLHGVVPETLGQDYTVTEANKTAQGGHDKVTKTASWKIVGLATNKNPPAITTGGGNLYKTGGLGGHSKNTGETYYSFPPPGTGSAGTVCDPAKPIKDPTTWNIFLEKIVAKTGSANTGNDSTTEETGTKPKLTNAKGEYTLGNGAEDHPCNWNKIAYGGAGIDIPLYGYDPKATEDEKYKSLEFDDFIIRVRAPCDNPDENNVCAMENRHTLDESEGQDDVLINWMFLGNCDDGAGGGGGGKKSCYLIPPVAPVDELDTDDIFIFEASNFLSSIINAEQKNPTALLLSEVISAIKGGESNGNFIGINQLGKDRILTEFFTENLASDFVLRLTVTKSPKVPYLEYQILYKPKFGTLNLPIVGNPTILAEGYSGGVKKTLKATLSKTAQDTNYAVQN